MKATYIGDPAEGPKPSVPDTFEAFGLTFEKGKATTVEDPAVFAKLEGNSHFKTEGKAPATAETK